MALTIALQMDAMTAINPAGDSTLVIAREAQRRGHTLWHYTPDRLTSRSGKIVAAARPLKLHEGKNFYTLGKETELNLETMDVIWLRQDPPFDMAYMTTTYLLEKLKRPKVFNNPASVRNHPEKLMPMQFPKYTPPTLISADMNEIARFRAKHKSIVVKPLYGHGGRGVFRIRPSDNFKALMSAFFSEHKEPCVVQPFLPEVKDQERRIIIIDGKYAGIIGRIPPAGEFRSNMVLGGTPVKAEPTKRQLEICKALGPVLKKHGILLAGIDVIGDWLNEINITSPTGLVAINRLYGKKLESKIWDAVEAKL